MKDVRGRGEAFGRFVGRKDELRAHRRGARRGHASARRACSRSAATTASARRACSTRWSGACARAATTSASTSAACPPRGREFPLSGIVCMLQVLCGAPRGTRSDRILAVQPRLRALGLHDEEVSAVLTALGATVRLRGQREGALRHAFARMVAEPVRGPAAHVRVGRRARDGRRQLRRPRGGAARLPAGARRVPLRRRARASRTRSRALAGARRARPRRLSPADVERLVALPPRRRRGAGRALRFVRERAGGHPQFIEEVIKGAASTRGRSPWPTARLVSMKLVGQDLALPKTLRGLVASRVARLSARTARRCRRPPCSAIRSTSTVLASMLGQPMAALEGAIAAPQGPRVRRRTRGPSELRFASPIVREVVVDALTPEAAREMHAAAGARARDACSGPRVGASGADRAHLYEAGDRERAATYFAKSGERRLEARQLEAAARDYARAIALTDRHGARRPASSTTGSKASRPRCASCARRRDAPELCARVIERVDRGAAVGESRARARRVGPHARRASSASKRRATASPRPRPSPGATRSSSSPCSSRTPSWRPARATSSARCELLDRLHRIAQTPRATTRKSIESPCTSPRRTRPRRPRDRARRASTRPSSRCPTTRPPPLETREGARARRVLHARLRVGGRRRPRRPSTWPATWASPTR